MEFLSRIGSICADKAFKNLRLDTYEMKEINLNYYTISDYAQRFARLFCDPFYQKHPAIKGEQILSLCPEPQINLLVVKNIFIKWKEEIESSKSPLFDYENPEVQKAHQNLMNTLSRNIRIERKLFEPLLMEAVEETLLWILSPFDYFKKLSNNATNIDIEEQIGSIAKYIRIRKPFFEKIVHTFRNEGTKKVNSFELLAAVRLAWEKEPGQNTELLLATLFKIQPANFQDFFLVEAPAFAEKGENTNFFDMAENVFDQEIGGGSFETANDQNNTQKSSAETNNSEEPSFSESGAGFKPFRLSYEQEEEQPSVRSRIALEQKFRFINELFEGNSQAFEEALDVIEKCTDYHKAIMLIKEKYFRRYSWDLERNEVKEFYEIISSRFLN